MRTLLRNVLQIEDGLNPLHRRYLEYLTKVRRASLDSIIFATRIDRKTILREVEPVLISRNLIMITSKGRILL
jgi:Holliday junction resolvasome RuvABC ATP-dependent DNA helicase subunit